jgi:hypothetical protein
MALNFPANPVLNETFWDGYTTWQWNGVSWEIKDDGGGGAFATIAQYRAKVPNVSIPPDIVFGAAAPVVLPGTGTVTPDFSLGFNFSCALTANRTLANPLNVTPGQTGWINFTGSFSISTYGSSWRGPGGLKPAFSGSNNTLFYTALSASQILVSISSNHAALG